MQTGRVGRPRLQALQDVPGPAVATPQPKALFLPDAPGQTPTHRPDQAESHKKRGQHLTLAHLEKGLAEISAKLPNSTDRTERAKLTSRLKQLTDQLSRLDPATVDPQARARLGQLLASLGADGGQGGLRQLLDKVRGWISPETLAVGPADFSSQAGKIKALRQQIAVAASAYGRGDYEAAYARLTDAKFAQSMGFSLNTQNLFLRTDPATWDPADLDSVVMQARMSSMSWDTGKIDIVDAGLMPKEGRDYKTLPELPVLAQQLLPIMLEEWMHQLQRLTGQPVSKLSEAYCQDKGIPWSSSLHEMDIQAAFREWGYPVDKLGTVHAYRERGQFEDWYQSKGKT